VKIFYLHTFSFAELISDTSQIPAIPSHDIIPKSEQQTQRTAQSKLYTHFLLQA